MMAADEPLQFETAAGWLAWLKQHHRDSPGVWLRLARLGSGQASVTHPQALEIALCYGWIDGVKKNDGPAHWLQRFTPRSARSIWSRINREKALALERAGRMRAAGRAEIERAKADGRWDAAYESQSRSTVPADLQAALDASPKAAQFFATLDSKNRYAVLFRIHGAKRAETRERRIRQFVEMLARGEKLHP